MSYYTDLKLCGRFSKNNSIYLLKNFTDWYNSLSYDDYIEKYHCGSCRFKIIKDKKFFTELEEFLLDRRSNLILQELEFHEDEHLLKLELDCSIKNYTDTYNKLYNLLLKCNPLQLDIYEKEEAKETPNIFEFQNNKLIQKR